MWGMGEFFEIEREKCIKELEVGKKRYLRKELMC